MYSALDIAKYIIDQCMRENCPISNLQLQKILYYIQREFLQQGEQAFPEEIEAWQFGPVVPVVYRQYCGFGGSPIRMRYGVIVEQSFQRVIDPIVKDKRTQDPWDLVSDTHSPGKAWDLIFRSGAGDHQIIPRELIRSKG